MKSTTDEINYNWGTTSDNIIWDRDLSTTTGDYVITDTFTGTSITNWGGYDSEDPENFDYFDIGFTKMGISKRGDYKCEETGKIGFRITINAFSGILTEEQMLKFAERFMIKKKLDLI